MQSRDLAAADADYKLAQLVATLRSGGPVSDSAFDAALYPLDIRRRSKMFWTPIDVARRVVQLLVPTRRTRILDVGSGVGKFCVVGAAMTGATFVGVEHRERLFDVAAAAASRARLPTARFLHRDFNSVDVQTFDAVYIYNPFEENVWPREEWLDTAIPLSFAKAKRDVENMEGMLELANPGTRVVTYHGFGGDMPRSYKHLFAEPHHNGHLDLWVKAA